MITQTKNGFTLIELLITTALLSMIISLGTYAYSTFSKGWNGQLGHFNQTAKGARNFNTLHKSLSSTTPLVVQDKLKKIIYFQGNNQSVKAVSLNGIFNTNTPVLYELSLIDSNLVYQEVSLEHIPLVTLEQNYQYTHSVNVVEDITAIEIKYYGWDSIQDKTDDDSSIGIKKRDWYSHYLGQNRGLVAEKISINFIQNISNIQGEINFLESQLLINLSANEHVLKRYLSSQGI